MALRSALRYALAGATGAAEGYGAKQARLRQEEQQRLAQQRQARLDQLDLEEKTASLLSSGFMPEEEVAARKGAAISNVQSTLGNALAAVSGGTMVPMSIEGMKRTEEGALGYNTGRKTTLGGRSFVLPETSAERTERTKRTDAMMQLRQTEAERSRLYTLAEEARKGGRNSPAAFRLGVESPQAYNQLFPDPSSGFASLNFRQGQAEIKAEQQKNEAEAWFNTPRPAEDRRLIAQAFNAIRAANPNAPARDIILAVYQAYGSEAKTENVQARTGLTEARTDRLRNPRGGRPPASGLPRAPGAAAPTESTTAKTPSKEDMEMQAIFNQHNTKKR